MSICEGSSTVSRNTSGTTQLSLTDQAYDRMKALLIECRLPPGSQVTEAGLSADLGFGKTPTREALARLVQQGWIRSVPGHGYRILPVTLGEVRELYEARMVVEPAAVRLAAGRLTPEIRDHLYELCEAHAALEEVADETAFVRQNREFHSAVIAATGNRLLVDLLAPLLERAERLTHLSLLVNNSTSMFVHEHRELVAALDAGDADGAERIAHDHISSGRQSAIEALLETPALQAAAIDVAGGVGE
jgi:DNA-binding GntR family transcriptional regulator